MSFVAANSFAILLAKSKLKPATFTDPKDGKIISPEFCTCISVSIFLPEINILNLSPTLTT